MSITKAFGEFIAALGNLMRARVKGKLDPCRPHDWIENGDFCRKCGTYR